MSAEKRGKICCFPSVFQLGIMVNKIKGSAPIITKNYCQLEILDLSVVNKAICLHFLWLPFAR